MQAIPALIIFEFIVKDSNLRSTFGSVRKILAAPRARRAR